MRKRGKAQITDVGKNISIGRFKDEVTAARRYDDFARNLFGEFAVLNFPTVESSQ